MHRSIVMFCLFLVLSIVVLQAQDFETVPSAYLKSSGSQASYVVNQECKLQTGFSLNANTDGPFFVKANKTSNGISSPGKNSIRVETLKKKTTTEQSIPGATLQEKSVSYEFFDGLGRSIQSIDVQQSPSQCDLVAFKVYDAYGREPKKYLQYTINGNAEFRALPEVEQNKFYSQTALVAKDSEPYSIAQFSPNTNELMRTYAPGWSWHNDTDAKPTSEIFKFNTSNEVQYWSTYSGTGTPVLNGYYAPGTLVATESKKTNASSDIQFKDSFGRSILEKQGLNGLWRLTYSIYDHAGNLRFVFPPEAVLQLNEYQSSSNKQEFIDRWCFQYRYDEFNRQTEKKLPGADWVYTLFDRWDRIALVQDGEQRLLNQWTFTKYDNFNRPILTGITTGTKTTLLDALKFATVRYETRANNSIGYTNVAIPAHDASNLLSINYYDDYAFIAYTGWEDNGTATSYNFITETGYPKTTDVHQISYPSSTSCLTSVKGYQTGSKIKILNTSLWLNAVTYYDKQYQVIQQIGQNHLGFVDRATTCYDFLGKKLKTLQRHGANIIVIQKEYTYDHAGRPLRVYHQIDNGPSVILSQCKYNELGQVIEKNLHSVDNGVSFLQSIDYRYNIQGWLTHINNSKLVNDQNVTNDDANDLFGLELVYNQSNTVNGVPTAKLFHGNISAIKWNANNLIDPVQEKIFAYDYDAFDRLKASRFATANGLTWNGSANMFNESMGYDLNGNIKTLKRNGCVNGAVAVIDDLVYHYASLSTKASNALRHVVDKSSYWSGNTSFGYVEKDITHSNFVSTTDGQNNTEYEYYRDGNLKSDLNKEITQINYNHLDFPERIQFSENREIEYQYNALGEKLSVIARYTSPQKILERVDYVGAIEYYNGKVASIQTVEGRVVKGATGYEYEYFLRDHQQNVRIVFGSGGTTANYLATLESVRAGEEGKSFKNIAGDGTFNHTFKSPEIVAPSKASKLNVAIAGGKAIGPSIMLPVKGGDNIQSEVFGLYTTPITGANTLVSNIAALVTTGFGLSSTGETRGLFTAVTNYLPAKAAAVPAGGSYPKAYLCYILFEKVGTTYVGKQFGFTTLPEVALNNWQALNLDLHVPESITDGVALVYVANESNINTSTSVFFDDLSIVHQSLTPRLQVYQSSDYYPFGLSFNTRELSRNYYDPANSSVTDVQGNRNQFQDQELQKSFDLSWYHYKYRMHDPALGRFSALDPLAEEYRHNSVYAFSENRLIDGIELEGAEFLNLLWLDQMFLQTDADLSGLQVPPVEYDPEFSMESYYFNNLAWAANVTGGWWNGLVGSADFLLSPRNYVSTLEATGAGINNYFTEPDFLGRNYDIAKDFINDPHAGDKIGTFALSFYLPKVGFPKSQGLNFTPAKKPSLLNASDRYVVIGQNPDYIKFASKFNNAKVLDLPHKWMHLPKQEAAKFLWRQNSSKLRGAIREGFIPYDIGYGRTFYKAEQLILDNKQLVHTGYVWLK